MNKKIYIIILVLITFSFGGVASANWFSDLFKKSDSIGASVFQTFQGGTGTSTVPNYGKVLVGNDNGRYDVVSTSTLGLLSSESDPIYTAASTSYFYLPGRIGGQTAYGGTGSGDKLTLYGSSDSTSGGIQFGNGIFTFSDQYTAQGTAGITWKYGSKLIETESSEGNSVDRMLYQPNGDRFEVLNEGGNSILMSVNGTLSGRPDRIYLLKATAIGSAATVYTGGIVPPTNGLYVEGNTKIVGAIGHGTDPSAINFYNSSINGTTYARGAFFSNVYSGTAQEAIGTYNQVYGVGSHASARAIGGRFDALDYSLTRSSGSASTYGGWFDAKDRTGTFAAGALHQFIGGYFQINDATGDWTTNNPSVQTYGNFIAAQPTGFGSNHTHWSLYSVSGNNYFGGNVGIATTSPSSKLSVNGSGYFTGALGLGIAPDPVNFLINGKGTTGSGISLDTNSGYNLLFLKRGGENIGYYGLGSILNDDIQFATYNNTLGKGNSGLRFITNSLLAMYASSTGRIYLNNPAGTYVDPTAKLHISAGSATANTAPLKFTAGTNMSVAESGAVEWNGTDLFLTDSSSTPQRYPLVQGIFGAMRGDNVDIVVDITSQDVYTQVGTGLSDNSSSGFTFLNSTLTAGVAGKYIVNWNMSISTASANDEIEGELMVDGTATETGGSAHTQIQNANTPKDMGSTGVLTLTAGQVVSMSVKNKTGTGDVTVNHGNLTLFKISN